MVEIKLPDNVNINWGSDFVSVQGPLGVLIKKRGNFYLAQKENSVFLWTPDNLQHKESFYLSLLNRMIVGVSRGFRQRLKLVGVGFKASLRENILVLKLGYSHEVLYPVPSFVEIKISKNKGTFVLIKGIEYSKVMQVSKNIRSFRAPDPYKGKEKKRVNKNGCTCKKYI